MHSGFGGFLIELKWSEKLQAIADAVVGMESTAARDFGRVCPVHRKSGGEESVSGRVYIGDERRVSFGSGVKILFHTDMQLSGGPIETWHYEPTSASSRQQRGLRHLRPAEDSAVKITLQTLTTGKHPTCT